MSKEPVEKPAGPEGVWRHDVAVFVTLMAAYALTLHPSVAGGDSGELIAVAWTGGVAHPPGYPLYTMLAGAFARVVAVGEVAWRINLFTAVCSALAALLLRRLVAAWGRSAGVASATALLFGLAPLIWTWAVAAEVFSLNNLFLAMLCWLAWQWSRTGEPRLAYWGAFTLALGLTNHHTLVLFAGPLALWALYGDRERLCQPLRLVRLVTAFAVGLVPYFYLPVAAALDPPIAWGDPSSPGGLWHHLLRRDYGTLRLGGELPAGAHFALLWRQLGETIVRNTLGVGWLLALMGCVTSMWRGAFEDSDRQPPAVASHHLGRAIFAAWCCYLLVFTVAANLPVDQPLFREVTARFWQLPLLIVFLWIGLGVAWIAHRFQRPILIAAVALGLTALQGLVHFPTANQRSNHHVADYAAAILRPLPQDAVLLTSGDLVTNSVRYLQLCRGVREDVTVVDLSLATRPWYVRRLARRHPELRFPAGRYHPGHPEGFSLAEWLAANREREVWVYPEFGAGDASTAELEAWPVGLPSRVAFASDPTEETIVAWRHRSREALDALRDLPWPAAERFDPGTWEHVVLDDLWQAEHRRAVFLLTLAIARDNDPGLLEESRTALHAIAAGHPAPPYLVFKNLGIAYDRGRERDPGLRQQRDRAWRRYLELAPARDPDRANIAAALQQGD